MSEENSSFLTKVAKILEKYSRPGYAYPSSPSALLQSWQTMISECKKGYRDNIYEYDNDLFIRAAIEMVLSSELLQRHDELIVFSQQVKILDEEFSAFLQKEIIRPNYLYWWEQRIPRYAGKELANDFFEIYGAKVDVM